MITIGPSVGSTTFVPIVLAPILAFFLWLAFTGELGALSVVALLGLVIAYLATVRLVFADGVLTMHRLFVRVWSVPVTSSCIEIIDGSGWPQLCVRSEGKQWCVSTGELNLIQLGVLLTALERGQTNEVV